MTAGRDGLDALEDILQNMELATSFLRDFATVDDLEGDRGEVDEVAAVLVGGEGVTGLFRTC